jgi:hypothetical protein
VAKILTLLDYMGKKKRFEEYLRIIVEITYTKQWIHVPCRYSIIASAICTAVFIHHAARNTMRASIQNIMFKPAE